MTLDQCIGRFRVRTGRYITNLHVREGVELRDIFYGGLSDALADRVTINEEVVAQRRRVDLPMVGNRRREAGQHQVLAELDVGRSQPEEEDAARLDAALRVGASESNLPIIDLVRFFLRGLCGEGRHARGGWRLGRLTLSLLVTNLPRRATGLASAGDQVTRTGLRTQISRCVGLVAV